MGFHFLLIALKDSKEKDPIALLKTVGYSDVQKINNAQNTRLSPLGGSEYAHVGESGGWTLIWGDLFPPLSFYDTLNAEELKRYKDFEFLSSGFEKVSVNSKLLACVVESTSGSYGYDWYVDRKLNRRYWEVEGVPYKQTGELLPGESELLSQLSKDETAILLLVEKLVIPIDDIEEVNYDTFKIVWPETKVKSKFKFW